MESKLRPATSVDALRLATEKLRWKCDPSVFPFATTDEVEPLRGIVGQESALEALRFGLEIFSPGQNVFVRGLSGTGRLPLVRQVLDEMKPACKLTSDYCYVSNFERPEAPRLIALPRGRGFAFRDAIDEWIRFLRKDLPPALQSDGLRQRRQFIDERFEEEAKKLSTPFEEELSEDGLAMVTLKVGDQTRQAILPVIDGEPAPPEKIQMLAAEGNLTADQMAEFEQKISKWGKRFEDLTAQMRAVGQRHATAVRELFQNEIRDLAGKAVEPLRSEFASGDVAEFVDGILAEVLKHGLEVLGDDTAARRFRVNVVLGRCDDDDCPVIVEGAPTLSNLLGTIDRRVLPDGTVLSDHLMISAGSLLRADGGYLILEAREVLREPGAWRVLVRALRTRCLEIVPPEFVGPWTPRSLKPEPIPINLKVILIGDPGLYYALDAGDPDFPHLFKVLADFDTSVPRDEAGLAAYAGLFARIAQDEKLLPLEASAIAVLAEHGARIEGSNSRLTTLFGRLVDIAREAAFLAGRDVADTVSGDHVREAIRRRKKRGDMPSRKFREHVKKGSIHLRTDGAEVGQVNGLAVIHAGPLVYGIPARITATIGAGHRGTINIEHESRLSGSIHTKGFHILEGLLRHLLRTQHPLAFTASLAFEQSYGGIDGDSASGAEMCCLLSALIGVPLRQDLAMTGAIDQHGRIQPIGGATEKVEGFYDACVDLGLTGKQGVVLPRANVGDLMLREDIVEACDQGRFHVYAVESIFDALEVFTGYEAGKRGEDGEYPEGSLLRLAIERAFDFWALASASPVWESDDDEDENAKADAAKPDAAKSK